MSGGQSVKLLENSGNSGELRKEFRASSPIFQSEKSATADPPDKNESAARGVGVPNGADPIKKARQNLHQENWHASRPGATEKLTSGAVSKSSNATLIASGATKMPSRHFDSAAAPSAMSLTDWARTVPTPSIVATRILVTLAERADEHGEAQISMGTLAHLSATSAQTTRKNLKRLESLGILTVTVTRRADGGQDAHLFRLNREAGR
jgi:hypothetical protein